MMRRGSCRSTPISPPSGAAVPARRPQPQVLAAIAAGGALGAPARYALSGLVHVGEGGVPWATFGINVSGSFALGLVLILVIERFPPSRYPQPFFATGFLGAYTTFSTFAVEIDLLIKDGHLLTALVYAAASLSAGLAAVWAGTAVARRLPLPPRARRGRTAGTSSP